MSVTKNKSCCIPVVDTKRTVLQTECMLRICGGGAFEHAPFLGNLGKSVEVFFIYDSSVIFIGNTSHNEIVHIQCESPHRNAYRTRNMLGWDSHFAYKYAVNEERHAVSIANR